MTKKELCDCIVAVARSPSEDDQVNKMVRDLIEQYIKDSQEVLAASVPLTYSPGEVRKIILRLLVDQGAEAGPLYRKQIATSLYGSSNWREMDAARKALERLIKLQLVKRVDSGYQITRTGIALHVALSARAKSAEGSDAKESQP